MVCNTGIGVALSAIVHYQRADLYHLRLIYDTVSLAGHASNGLTFPRSLYTTDDLMRLQIKLVMLQHFYLASHASKLPRQLR
jgi:hypothetical protein